MEFLELSGKKYLIGMDWGFFSGETKTNEKELRRVVAERNLQGELFGVTTEFHSETIEEKTIVTTIAGFGILVSPLNFGKGISKNPRKFYSLGNLVSNNIQNGLIVVNLDGEVNDKWWFCAIYHGAVVPGTDVYGTSKDVIEKASEFIESSATAIFGKSEMERVRLFVEVDSISTALVNKADGADINLEVEKDNFIKLMASFENGVRPLRQLIGVDKELVAKIKKVAVIALISLVVIGGGTVLYHVFKQDSVVVDLSIVAEQQRKLQEALKERKRRQELSDKQTANNALLDSVHEQLNEAVYEAITDRYSDWLFRAMGRVDELPITSMGYVFEEVHCDYTQKCKAYWVSRESTFTLPKEFSLELNKFSPKYKVRHSKQANKVSKVFEYLTEKNKFFDFAKEEVNLPNIVDQTNKFINLVKLAKNRGLLHSWNISETKVVERESIMPEKTLTNFNLEPYLKGFLRVDFELEVNNTATLKGVYDNIFKDFNYLGVRSFSIINKKGNIVFLLTGSFIAHEKI